MEDQRLMGLQSFWTILERKAKAEKEPEQESHTFQERWERAYIFLEIKNVFLYA
jgi:hypothetical protein